MYRILDDFLHITAQIYPSYDDAEHDRQVGGSGFLIGVPSADDVDLQVAYAVTNKHTIENGNTVIRLNRITEGVEIFDLTEQDWLSHPDGDDIAITPLQLSSNNTHYKVLNESVHFPRKKIFEELNIGPGDEVFIPTRSLGISQADRNIPVFRFGHISRMPEVPIQTNWPRGKQLQDSYIIEARSISGYSGAPVMVALNPLVSRELGKQIHTSKILLLGINWGYINDSAPVLDSVGRPTQTKINLNTGLMTIVPSYKLTEFLQHPHFLELHTESCAEMMRLRGP